MPIRFVYFDLGEVILHFDRQRQFDQMAAVAQIEPDRVRTILMESGLHVDYETGRMTAAEVHARFCAEAGITCDLPQLEHAGSDIFTLNDSIVPVVAGLRSAGYRLGILSNTCDSHWRYCRDRYAILRSGFGPYVLSYEVGAMKPDRAIYAAAVDQAGVAREEILFIDDLEANIAGAAEFGLDTILYRSTPSLVTELRKRELRWND